MWNFKLFQFSEFSNEFFNISLPCLSKATLRKIMCQWPPFLRLRACIPVTWPRRLLRRQLKKSQIMTPSVKLSVRQSGRNQSIFLSYLFIYLEVMRLKFHVKSVLIRGFMWHFSAKVLRWFESKLEGDCQLFLTSKQDKLMFTLELELKSTQQMGFWLSQKSNFTFVMLELMSKNP